MNSLISAAIPDRDDSMHSSGLHGTRYARYLSRCEESGGEGVWGLWIAEGYVMSCLEIAAWY